MPAARAHAALLQLPFGMPFASAHCQQVLPTHSLSFTLEIHAANVRCCPLHGTQRSPLPRHLQEVHPEARLARRQLARRRAKRRRLKLGHRAPPADPAQGPAPQQRRVDCEGERAGKEGVSGS